MQVSPGTFFAVIETSFQVDLFPLRFCLLKRIFHLGFWVTVVQGGRAGSFTLVFASFFYPCRVSHCMNLPRNSFPWFNHRSQSCFPPPHFLSPLPLCLAGAPVTVPSSPALNVSVSNYLLMELLHFLSSVSNLLGCPARRRPTQSSTAQILHMLSRM